MGKFTISSHVVRFSDVSAARTRLGFYLRSSKSDQHCGGCSIRLKPTARSVCPIRPMYKFMALRRDIDRPDAPVFLFANGHPLTRHCINRWLHRLLHHLPNVQQYPSHSFHTGAASTAASNNVSLEEIQRVGRWKSMPSPTTFATQSLSPQLSCINSEASTFELIAGVRWGFCELGRLCTPYPRCVVRSLWSRSSPFRQTYQSAT